MGYPPTVETQRAILTNMRNDLQNNGFASEMNAEALRAQDPGPEPTAKAKHEQQIKDFEGAAKNAYAGARRLDEKLAKLPKPKPEKKK